MALDDVVNLNISRSAASVSRQGFGVMLILGTSATGWNTDRIRTYTKAADMLTDGFTTASAEYKEALAAFGQKLKPTSIKVGLRLAPVAQVNHVAITTVENTTAYKITIDGTDCLFTSDADALDTEIQTGLIAAVTAANVGMAATAGAGTDITLTASQAGIAHVVGSTANLTVTQTTANVGVQTDLAQIQAIDNDWYALVLTSNDANDILDAAAWMESQRKIFIPCSGDAGVIAAGNADVASRLKTKAFARSAFFYSADKVDGAEAGILGQMLPLTPGSATFKFKTITGITPDNLTPTQLSVAAGKNANTYTTVGGINMFAEGKVADGEFLDVIMGCDWIQANMQADVFQALVDNPKVPYTDDGIGLIGAQVLNRLKLAEKAGILVPGSSVVNLPAVADVSSADKANRLLSGITFSGTLAGAIHAVSINGYVSV